MWHLLGVPRNGGTVRHSGVHHGIIRAKVAETQMENLAHADPGITCIGGR